MRPATLAQAYERITAGGAREADQAVAVDRGARGHHLERGPRERVVVDAVLRSRGPSPEEEEDGNARSHPAEARRVAPRPQRNRRPRRNVVTVPIRPGERLVREPWSPSSGTRSGAPFRGSSPLPSRAPWR